ncbi:MAG: hypothetical protein VR69_15650 [Peptococcaceae bacterium BRH_c4b]|nr:MAG: hypothetical protein VR69_15650 [Peptococcaceae bacterium BRH_c4b]
MEPQYNIIPDLQDQNCLTINPNTAKQNNILVQKKWFLRFGIQVLEIKLKTSSRINENEVKLSLSMIDSLNIPLSCRYEIRPVDNEILIGPYIGILVTSRKDYLERSVQYLTSYLYDYAHIGGAVVAFSLEGIDPDQYSIDGYIFNPEKNQWEQGVYSYPAAVFKITYLNKRWRNYFQTVFGNRIFNSYVFNKWEMYKWLCQVPQLNRHLPETTLYKDPKDLESFLHLHQQIYVKPVNGSHGLGIYKVSKMEEYLKIDYDQDGIHYSFSLSNIFDLAEFFRSQFKRKKYILQQAIDLISIEGKNIDFRIVLAKNQAGAWKDMIMVAKYGKSGSIVTNIKSGGSAEIGEITLKKMFDLSDEEVFRWRQKISHIILEAVKSIEQFGVHCGNLGIDIAIDTQKRIWIIEMNNLNPDPLIALDVNNRKIFYKIKHMNMLYAKKLAGFPEEV